MELFGGKASNVRDLRAWVLGADGHLALDGNKNRTQRWAGITIKYWQITYWAQSSAIFFSYLCLHNPL